jgi:hypothetical protein
MPVLATVKQGERGRSKVNTKAIASLEKKVIAVAHAVNPRLQISMEVPAMESWMGTDSAPSMALRGIAGPAHQRRISKTRATAFAVRIDVVYGEIGPRQPA